MKYISKYKLLFIIAIIVCCCGIILAIALPGNKKITVINENLKSIAFKHDSTWKLKENKDNLIVLKHNSDSQIKIQITEINNDFKYSSIDELVDELLYGIQNQNKSYKLISKNNEVITNNHYNSYKFLYENDEEQVMVIAYKIGDKLVSIIYEASNDYFDILLDSVHSIVNSISIKDDDYTLRNSVQMNLSDIKYSSGGNIDNLIKGTKKYKTATNNYLVEYSIPDIFKLWMIDSTVGHYEYSTEDSKKIEITASVYKVNIYEMFDTERAGSVYSSYSYYRDNTDGSMSNFKEVLSKLNGKYDGYIYRCSYNDTGYSYDDKFEKHEYTRNNEIARVIYALDNNHIFDIEIKTTGLPITKKLIDSIKIDSVTNYSSYVLNEKEGNNIVGTLKTFSDYKRDKITNIKLLIPDKYEEYDSVSNSIYASRYYRINYDEEYDLYDYEIEFKLDNTVSSFEEVCKSRVDIVNSIYVKSTYGKSQNLTFTKKMTINGKEFYIYDGGYTDRSGVMLQTGNRKYYYVNKKMLFYKVSDKLFITITIDGNDKAITDKVLEEVTNFTINEENV